MIPSIAIVGRPNVGKSTLYNRLMRGRHAIVQDDPGVTRDRRYGITRLDAQRVQLIDTGGLELDATCGIGALVRQQTELAIEEADIVILVLDARQGLVSADLDVAQALRRSGKPVVHVANKVDGPGQEAVAVDLFRIGAKKILCVSAEHGLGLEELVDQLIEMLPPTQPDDAADAAEDARAVRIALVGRPNAGKSSLVNALTGQQRAIVSEQPGTTRDPIDVRLETPDGPVVVVDTAGIRRKRRKNTAMEHYAMVRAMRSIDSADVACLVIDSTLGITEQDAKIATMAIEAGRGLVLLCTKSDLLRGQADRKRVVEQLNDQLGFALFAPLLWVSALTRKGLQRILPTVRRVHRTTGVRIQTAELNRFLEEVTSAHAHPAHRSRPVRFYFISQPETRPPTFLVSTNVPARAVRPQYKRYLANKLRERFGFEGAPLRVFFRKRGAKRGPTSP